ncbi:MAG: MFS transporter [Deltaproteobacteria bacterium]|nr:MFS transporter [Deltaproteobacteria bacterium]
MNPLFVLAVAIFCTMLGNGVVMPFVPLYAQQFGAASIGAGVLFSAHSAPRTFLLPLIGPASDRMGRRAFLLVGVLFYAISSVAFLLANSMLLLLLVMAVQGVATAMVQPVTMAYVGDLTPKGKEGAYSGYINTAFLGGVAGGPILGGVIKDLWNMEASFIALGVLSVLAFVVMFFWLPDPPKNRTTGNTISPPLREVFSCRPVLGVSFYRLGYAFASTITWVFVPLLAAHMLPLKTSQIGALISLNVLVSTVLQAPFGRLADRMSKANLIAVGGIISAIAFSAFPLATSFWHLLVLSVFTGAATGVAFPAHTALAMENARGLGMGTVMSFLLTVHSFGMTVCPLLFGFIADHFGIASTFYGGGLLCALTTVLCYMYTRSATPELSASATTHKEAPVAD